MYVGSRPVRELRLASAECARLWTANRHRVCELMKEEEEEDAEDQFESSDSQIGTYQIGDTNQATHSKDVCYACWICPLSSLILRIALENGELLGMWKQQCANNRCREPKSFGVHGEEVLLFQMPGYA